MNILIKYIIITRREIFVICLTNRFFIYKKREKIRSPFSIINPINGLEWIKDRVRDVCDIEKNKNHRYFIIPVYIYVLMTKQEGDCITWAFRLDKFLQGCESAFDLCTATVELIREIYSRFFRSLLSFLVFRKATKARKSLSAIFNSVEI